jgi:hypothetical protein
MAGFKRFYLLRLPLAVGAIIVAGQIAAMSLANMPLRRQRTDDLPLAVETDPLTHRVILIGDSITRNATRRYNVGSEADVLNLATNALIGLTGSELMIQRYLAKHTPPQFLVIIATPNMYATLQNVANHHYYLWNVFRRPDERAFLKQVYPAIDSHGWLPAVFDLQQRIVEPAVSALIRSRPHYDPIGKDPDPSTPLEADNTSATSPEALVERMNDSTTLKSAPAAALRRMCELSNRYGFKIDIVWPPSPKAVVDHWNETGAIGKLESEIHRALGPGCEDVPFTNLNAVHVYTVFDHVGFHLRGDGWEQFFADQLKRHIAGLTTATTANSQ